MDEAEIPKQISATEPEKGTHTLYSRAHNDEKERSSRFSIDLLSDPSICRNIVLFNQPLASSKGIGKVLASLRGGQQYPSFFRRLMQYTHQFYVSGTCRTHV